jgi:hypothetical protein
MGSLIGGLLYHEVGGKMALIIFCVMSLLCSILHFVLYECSFKHTMLATGMELRAENKDQVLGTQYRTGVESLSYISVAGNAYKQNLFHHNSFN